MPQPRKPPGTRQDRRPQRRAEVGLAVLPGGGRADAPPAPKGLLKSSQELWAAFWASPAAAGLHPVDVSLVEEWVCARDQWRRALNAVARTPVVQGSMGQPVQNPLMGWVASREAAMEKARRQIGVGLRNRADLGVSVGQAALTAAELNRMTLEAEAERVVYEGEGELLAEFGEAR